MSWDTVGGIQALGFGVAQDGPVGGLAVLQGKFGWKTVKILQIGFCRTQGALGPHSDCVVPWDTVGGIQALGCLQGPPQTGFGVAQDGPVEVLAVL